MVALGVAVAALLAAPFDQSWTFRARGTAKVSVSNINGAIDVQAGRGSDLVVKAHGDDPGQFRVDAWEEDGEIHVKICCGDECGEAGRERGPRRHGRDCRGDGRIDLQLTVPADTELNASNVSGRIRVAGVEGPQRLNNVSGRVSSEGTGSDLEVHSVSGLIELAPGRMGDTVINTVSGDVELRVPRSANATVTLSSLSGRIRGDVGEGSRQRWKIGTGGARVKAHSVSGGVRVTSQ